MLTDKEGGRHQYVVHDRDAVVAEAAKEGRELKIELLVVSPEQRFFPDLASVKAHYGEENALKAAGRAVAYVYFSHDPQHPDQAERVAKIDAELAGRRAVVKKITKDLASPLDGEQFDALRARLDAQEKAIVLNVEQRRQAAEAIIGPLSSTLWDPSPSDGRTLKLTASIPDPSTGAQPGLAAVSGL
jgi:hypothetical protein